MNEQKARIAMVKTGIKSQAELSRRTKINESYISLIISGVRNPTVSEMEAISEVLNCQVDELFPETLNRK